MHILEILLIYLCLKLTRHARRAADPFTFRIAWSTDQASGIRSVYGLVNLWFTVCVLLEATLMLLLTPLAPGG